MGTDIARAAELTVPLPITAGFLWLVFLVVLAGFCLASWMFLHHWKYYGIAGNNRVFVKGLYFVVSISLLVLMVLFISTYAIVS